MNNDQANFSNKLPRRQEKITIPQEASLCPDNPFVANLKLGLQSALLQAQDKPLTYLLNSLTEPLKLLIGLSGGPDSTSLLAAIVALSKSIPLSISACHINHNQRGQESLRDEEFCKTLCKTWNVPLEIYNLNNFGKQESEENLREARFECLTKCASKYGVTFILLGHTLDDQTETILFKLFRGAGHIGAMGMQPAVKLSNNLILLRPMLTITKQSCYFYLESIGISPLQDSSNTDVHYTRNYLRHEVLPIIEKRFPTMQKQLSQFREIVSADEQYLSELANIAMNEIKSISSSDEIWNLQKFNQQSLSIKRRLIKVALQSYNIEVTFNKVSTIIEFCFKMDKTALTLDENIDLRIVDNLLVWQHKKLRNKTQELKPWTQPLQIPGVNLIPPLELVIKIERFTNSTWENIIPPQQSCEILVDLTHVCLPLTVRYRLPNDIIQPLGMQELVKLKKYLHTHKPRPDTTLPSLDNCLVIADQKEVIWVPGIGLSHKVRIITAPTHCLKILQLAEDTKFVC